MFQKKSRVLSKKERLSIDQVKALQHWRSEKQWYHSFLCSQTATALFIFNAISSLDIQTTQITHTDGLVMLLSFRS